LAFGVASEALDGDFESLKEMKCERQAWAAYGLPVKGLYDGGSAWGKDV